MIRKNDITEGIYIKDGFTISSAGIAIRSNNSIVTPGTGTMSIDFKIDEITTLYQVADVETKVQVSEFVKISSENTMSDRAIEVHNDDIIITGLGEGFVFAGPGGSLYTTMTASAAPAGPQGPAGPTGPSGGGSVAIDANQIPFGTGVGITSSNIFIINPSDGSINLGNSHYNIVGGFGSSIIGGTYQKIEDSDYSSVISGGWSRIYNGSNSDILGGISNIIQDSDFSSIISGSLNIIDNSLRSVSLGGFTNFIGTSSNSTIIGGSTNSISGRHKILDSTIIGGNSNNIIGVYGFNSTETHSVVIIGGESNTIKSNYANDTPDNSVIVGGKSNLIFSNPSGGGGDGSYISTIVGGRDNEIKAGIDSSIVGGRDNYISDYNGSISNGSNNAIISGFNNSSRFNAASVMIGGNSNSMYQSNYSAIIGGTGLSLSDEINMVLVPQLRINNVNSSTASNPKVLIWDGKDVKYENASTILAGSVSTSTPIDLDQIAFGTGIGITSSVFMTFDSYNQNSKLGSYLSSINGSTFKSALVGGSNNTIDSTNGGVILGGAGNNLNSSFAGVIGGYYNGMNGSAYGSFIIGRNNVMFNASSSSILGGDTNFIGATFGNSGLNNNNTITGGSNNSIRPLLDSDYIRNNSITGGYLNSIRGNSRNNSITGGYFNSINGYSRNSSILNGYNNFINNSRNSSIVGSYNSILNDNIYSSIISGISNQISNNRYSSILGGRENIILNDHPSYFTSRYNNIIGGRTNKISSTALNGYPQIITNSLILGGENNYVNCEATEVSGGGSSVKRSIIIGGSRSIIGGYSAGSGGIWVTDIEDSSIISSVNSYMGGSVKRSVIIGGIGSKIGASNVYGVGEALNNMILSSSGSSIINNSLGINGSVIIGGQNLTLETSNTVYVPTLKIDSVTQSTSNDKVLVWGPTKNIEYVNSASFSTVKYQFNPENTSGGIIQVTLATGSQYVFISGTDGINSVLNLGNPIRFVNMGAITIGYRNTNTTNSSQLYVGLDGYYTYTMGGSLSGVNGATTSATLTVGTMSGKCLLDIGVGPREGYATIKAVYDVNDNVYRWIKMGQETDYAISW